MTGGKKTGCLNGALLLFAVLFVYYPAWNGTPLWDDNAHITRSELRSLHGLAQIWTKPGVTPQYYPLVHSVFWLAHRFWGDAPAPYHLLTILLHACGALLLAGILRRLRIPGAWLAAAIFALHPIEAESVAWITELKNTLSGLFFFSTVLVYLDFDAKRDKKHYAGALGLFILGLLSKSVIAPLPAALLVILWWKRGRLSVRSDVLPLAPFASIGIASGLFTAWVERRFIGAIGADFHFSAIERCLIAGRATWFYLGKIFWPGNLTFIYPRWTIEPIAWRHFLFPLFAILCAAALWAIRRKSRAPLAAYLYYCVMLFPAMGFFNVYPFRFSFVADHFQYLAGLGPIVLAAGGAVALMPGLHRTVRHGFCVVLLLPVALLAFLTWRNCRMYADAETLYRTTIEKNPACWMAYDNLGDVLLEKNGPTDRAMAYLHRALAIDPGCVEACNDLGRALLRAGRTGEAIACFRKAVAMQPDYPPAQLSLAGALIETGQSEEGMACFKTALALRPDYIEAHNNFGSALMQAGRSDEGMAHFRRALEIDPDNVTAHNNLGAALMTQGKNDEAAAHFTAALALSPADARCRYNLGIALWKLGRTGEAIAQFRRELENDPDNTATINNLGTACMQLGRVDEAMTWYRKALDRDPSLADVRCNYANGLMQLGKPREAVEQYKEVLALRPDDLQVRKRLFDAYLQAGQPDEAIAVAQNALGIARAAGKKEAARKIEAALLKIKR
jgi:tetratricopeptide (TPR) repeat protein